MFSQVPRNWPQGSQMTDKNMHSITHKTLQTIFYFLFLEIDSQRKTYVNDGRFKNGTPKRVFGNNVENKLKENTNKLKEISSDHVEDVSNELYGLSDIEYTIPDEKGHVTKKRKTEKDYPDSNSSLFQMMQSTKAQFTSTLINNEDQNSNKVEQKKRKPDEIRT